MVLVVDDIGGCVDGWVWCVLVVCDWFGYLVVLVVFSGGVVFFVIVGVKWCSLLWCGLCWVWLIWKLM